MLSESQLKAVDLLLEGEKTVKAIAEECGVSRTTMYAWMKLEAFQEKLTEMDEYRDQFLRKATKSRASVYLERLEELSETSANDMVRLNSTKELLGHAGWNTNVQDVNINDNRKQEEGNAMLEMWRGKNRDNKLVQ